MATVPLYGIVWGQCSPKLQDKLRALKTFEEMHESSDLITLLEKVKGIGNKLQKIFQYMRSYTIQRLVFFNIGRKKINPYWNIQEM